MVTYRLLLLENSEIDAEQLRCYLQRESIHHHLERVTGETEFLEKLPFPWDAVIADYDTPGFGATEALKLLKARGIDIPFLIISGRIGEENAVEALHLGADDFVMKSNLSRLGPALRRSIRECSRRRAETELRSAHEKAVSDREQLLAMVCHDLRNPLSSIRLATELLLSKMENDRTVSAEELQRTLRRVQRSCERIDGLVRDVLDKSRSAAGQLVIEPTKGSISQFLREVEEVFSPIVEEKKVKLHVVYPSPDLQLTFDRNRIFQVMSNLISNAAKFSPLDSEIRICCVIDEKNATFTIQDNGPGIAEEDRDHIFSKFYQNKSNVRQGTGLGLFIAREIVIAHEGNIGFDSQQGKGTTFWFTLPRSLHVLTTPPLSTTAGNEVLVVDDDDDLRGVMKAALENYQFKVRVAASVSEAIRIFADNFRPQVLVVDHDLPLQTGDELIVWLATQRNYQPLTILMSAHPDVFERAKRLGVTNAIQKPMRLDRLIAVINDGLQKRAEPGT